MGGFVILVPTFVQIVFLICHWIVNFFLSSFFPVLFFVFKGCLNFGSPFSATSCDGLVR